MSKTPNTAAVNPKIKVSANQGREEARNSHGGAQKNEGHYRTIVDSAVNTDSQATYSAKRKR